MKHFKSLILLTLSSCVLIGPTLGEVYDDQEGDGDETDPGDVIGKQRDELAVKVVEGSLLDKVKEGFPFITIIRDYLQYSSGSARVALIKLISIFDVNKDYILKADEVTEKLALAFAQPENAIAVTFDMYDLNQDDYISRYEMAQYKLVSESSDKNVYEIWKEVSAEFYEKDINLDNRVDINEFIMYDLYDIGKAIAAEIDAQGSK